MPTGILAIQKSTNEPTTLSDVQVCRHFTHRDMQLYTDCHMNLYLHVWVQMYGSAFPMMLVFQHTKRKSASRLMDVSIYRWSVCHYYLGHSLSSTQNQALKHSFVSCLFRQMCDAEADGFIYASEKRCLKNRQGKKDWRTGDIGIGFDLRSSKHHKLVWK